MIKPPQREHEHSFNGRGRWFKVRVSVVEISMAEQALNHLKVMSLLDQPGCESPPPRMTGGRRPSGHSKI
jgi:hypothetical protein